MTKFREGAFVILILLGAVATACGGAAVPTANPPAPAGTAAPATPGTVQVFVFKDLNGNGQLESNEPGVQDSVALAKGPSCSNVKDIIKATTQADGKYTFNNVMPGSYCVNYTGPSAVTSRLSVPLTLAGGQTTTVNFAVKPD